MASPDPQIVARVQADPEVQRLYAQMVASRGQGLAFSTPAGQQAGDALRARAEALGLDTDTFGFHPGANGQPFEIREHKDQSTWKALGKAGLYTGLAAGAAFAAPAIAGALGGGGAAGAGGATAANFGAGGIAGATGAAGAGAGGAGFLGSLGGVKGILGSVGPIAGAISGARGEGRLAEGMYDLQRGRAETERAVANTSIDDRRMQQALRLALLGGAADAPNQAPAHIAARMPTSGGGLRPSALAGSRDDIIKAMQPRILESLMSGDHVPELPDAPDSNWLDKILEGTSYAGAIMGALPKRQPTIPAPGINVPATNPNLVANSGVSFGQPKPRRGLLGY
jgi:hypothetical protein